MTSGTLTTGFTYNGAGDRVGETVDGVETQYTLDPAAGLTQVLQETTDGQTTSYLYGADLLAQYDSGTWAYHVNDGLGSVRQLADPQGQVVQSYSFSPFGVPLGESGGEPYGFTGEQWDASTGLLYLRARWYEPATGRFAMRDPWMGDWQRPQSLNGWSYVEGNPINRRDPSGRCWGPLKFLRRVPYYDQTCENLDMAIIIAGHPSTTPYQKAQAVAYVEAVAVSHIVLAEALVIGGYGWILEGGLLGGECSEQREEEPFSPPPASPPEEPYGPLPTPAPEGPYNGPLPFDQLPPYGGNPGGLPDEAFEGLGELTPEESRQIQEVVEEAGEPLWVVGSVADPEKPYGPESDIDYYYDFKGDWSHPFDASKLPGREHSILGRFTKERLGPGILFQPGKPPEFHPEQW